jgi:hypothetical protein
MTAKSCTFSLLAALLFASATRSEEVRGSVIKADLDKRELTIEARGRGVRGMAMRFLLDKDTQILLGRKPGAIADLTTGKRVRIVYEEQQGQRKALLVTLPAVNLILPDLGAAPGPIAPAPIDATSVVGTLRRVAFTDREIVVIGAGPKGAAQVETTLFVPEDAKITRDQKAIRFDDLKEAEPVLAQTEKRDGQLVATSVQVGAISSAQAPAKDDRKIERLRQILKMLDQYLGMMERR